MNAPVDNMMTQLKASPAKSATLGVLLLVLVILAVRVVLSGSPKPAEARIALPAELSAQPAPAMVVDAAAQELESAAAQSAQLWKTLRSRRGVSPQAAFRFDPAYYMVDPAKLSRRETSGKQVLNKSDTKTADATSTHAELAAPMSLLLQSTATGVKPTAVINSQIVQIGDSIQGYRLVAIRAREVVVKKDGQTFTLEMGR